MPTITVRAEWVTETRFDFDSAEDAQRFKDAVNGGDLSAIVEAGDIDSSGASLENFEAVGRVD